MINFCKKCGMCCRAIPLSMDLTKCNIENHNLLDGDIMIPNWIPIGRDKAIEINPRLADGGGETFFYSCRLLDERTNECMIHFSKMKPHVCREFPWYERVPYYCLTCADDCGFDEYYRMMKSFARLNPKIFMKGLSYG